jgi:hypothetical protein
MAKVQRRPSLGDLATPKKVMRIAYIATARWEDYPGALRTAPFLQPLEGSHQADHCAAGRR